ncbi:hypothetical protein KZZ52_28660 [Dactylosporangium sp. AC04546]|uniref:hypothetical protein n=1 Tax=Dactylosporangium sp. AC04546 TaxID=2862460 RepID=UPI001EE0122B|nr:hypothetical protein [Dactylosporangium sp. AC04546]WVK89242.1 hypothetical protein KZZ52_28660 [Dactylosporangium sp. AC04546]
MLQAKRTSIWRGGYEIAADGRPVTTWNPKLWHTGGDFVLAGRQYKVRANAWASKFSMEDGSGMIVASAERVGRKEWTISSDGQVYRFRRASIWRHEEELLSGDGRIGSVRRVSVWSHDTVADLPGLPLPVQVFALGVIVTKWDRQAASSG